MVGWRKILNEIFSTTNLRHNSIPNVKDIALLAKAITIDADGKIRIWNDEGLAIFVSEETQNPGLFSKLNGIVKLNKFSQVRPERYDFTPVTLEVGKTTGKPLFSEEELLSNKFLERYRRNKSFKPADPKDDLKTVPAIPTNTVFNP